MKNNYKQTFPHCLRPQSLRGWIASIGIAAMALTSFMVVGQSSPPNIPAIPLANEPLFGASTNEKPAMALALSVEYPTVGAQYRGANDYSATKEYIGYYDAEACYTYNDAPTETPRTGLTSQDYKRFDRLSAATNRKCSGETFSGNFLNWASNSAIDMLRLALSGGDRYIDEENLTILQRAILPDGDPSCFWNSSGYFPAKSLSKSVNGVNDYAGAIPESMRTTANANGNKIWIANKLNGIYFRANGSSAGNCTDSSGYTLGRSVAVQEIGGRDGYISNVPANPNDSEWAACDNNICTFSGTKNILYVERTGSKSKNYKYYYNTGPVNNADNLVCNRSNLGGSSDFASDSTIFCYVGDYTGAWKPSKSSIGLNTEGFFYSRVQVCNSSNGVLEDTRDFGLCKKYASNYYKPTGTIQKYSDQIRLSAFGYLMDKTDPKSTGSTASFGGVLRAPMKYVGHKVFDINGQYSGSNSKAEWDERTGQFVDNPEGNTTVKTRANVSATEYSSGVINYLNKFGRTGPTFGLYKTFDPVGELHYEVINYLQGKSPTASAISKITGTQDSVFNLRDGFPAYTTWDDPYGDGRAKTADYSCVKSNVVVVGDMNTHDGTRFPSVDIANNVFDATAWRDIVVKFEKKTSGTYIDGQGVSRTINNPNTANSDVPNSNDRSKLMGSAYWSHTHDIRGKNWANNTEKQRPGLRVKTFLFDVNENSASNDAVYRRTKNQFFMASKYGGFESDPSNLGNNPYNTYGNPFFNEKTNSANNKVWEETDTVKFPGRAGEASTYYLQSSAREVLSAFDEIFNRSSTKARSIAKPGANSATIKVGSTPLVYQGRFDTGDWSGDVEATEISIASDGTTSSTPKWSASARLAALSNPVSSRNIVIGTDAGATNFLASTSFNFLTTDEVKYLRGDQSLEGSTITGTTTWRKRGSLLGDVVNSGVVYSGPPSKNFTDAGYKGFHDDNKNRTPAVFAGSNDGMLHAFNANTGDELFAYIPKIMSSKLSDLTKSTFVGNHKNYVDGLIAIGEAKVGAGDTKTDWKTVLVAANGGGGRGVFALDVTNPSSFSAANAMWEFSSADDVDMGYVIGQPQILKLRTSATEKTYKWFAVVAGGVNNYVNDGSGRFSSTGKPAIFILSLDKSPSASWSLGSNYYKIAMPVDNTVSSTKPTGIANFSPILDSLGVVKEIFMGDYYGNIWNLQFKTRGVEAWKAPADWTSSKLSPLQKSGDAYPLYIAKDATGIRQVIHEAPIVLSGPIVKEVETFFVFAGTGKFIEVADKTSTEKNSIYAIFDDGTLTADEPTVSPPVAIKGRSRLIKGTIDASAKTVTVPSFFWGRPKEDADMTERAGWYAELPLSGERVVGVIQLLGRKAIFNTQTPATSGASGGCAAGSSTTTRYTVDIPTGNGSLVAGPGPESTALLFEDTSSANVTISDPTGRRIRTKTYRAITTGQGGVNAGDVVTVQELIGRLSWRQINNYQDLKIKANP